MHGMVFQPINMKNEQNITGSNTLTEDTLAPADSTPNTPGGTKPAKKMTRRVLIGGGIAAQHDLIEPRIRAQLAEKLPAQHFMPKNIRCASLGNRAGMIGALRWFLDSKATL